MVIGSLINKAYAQTVTLPGGNPPTVGVNNPLKSPDFVSLINSIIHYFTWFIAPSIVILMILYGAFRILTAAGDPEKFSEGRQAIVYAVVGYVLVLVAAGLVSVVKSAIGA